MNMTKSTAYQSFLTEQRSTIKGVLFTETPFYSTCVYMGELSEGSTSIEDGGKWILYCDHFEDGEWLNAGIIQDTNRQRLAPWARVKRGAGFTDWCPVCQDHANDARRDATTANAV